MTSGISHTKKTLCIIDLLKTPYATYDLYNDGKQMIVMKALEIAAPGGRFIKKARVFDTYKMMKPLEHLY